MKIKIKRYHPYFDPPTTTMEYSLKQNDISLLEAMQYIKKEIDRSLTFSYMCRSGVCGSCAVRVNGKEVLACEYKVKNGDIVEPLRIVDVIRDLVVDMQKPLQTLKKAKAYPLEMQKSQFDEEDEKLIERQSDCILCSSCYSSCPVYETNENFLGPFTLTRSYRYIADKRERAKKDHLEAVVENGIWDCTLCGNCTEVCPQGIDPKSDILMLQSWASKYGFQNPHLSSFGSFGLEF